MRITDLEVFLVQNPPPGYGGRYFVFVKLTASNGVVGYGEVYNASVGPSAMRGVVEDVFARYVIDQSPHAIEAMGQRIHGSGFSHRPDPTLMGAWSALEMACWDIVGKTLETPIYNLIGGVVNERLRTYTYLYPEDVFDTAFYYDSARSAAKAREMVEMGFSAVKCDPAGLYTAFDPHQPTMRDLERSVEMVGAIRDAVGSRADILFGTHGQITRSRAIRMAEAIAPYQPLWFEEPTPPDMPEAMAEVARASRIPIATGERLTTRYEFARVLQLGAANIVQLNTGRCGGILEAKKIATLAQVHYAQIAPHLYCGPLVAAANMQIAVASPNFLILESIGVMDGFHRELVDHSFDWQEGHIPAPNRPGLGFNLNEKCARAHALDDEQHLHLNMYPNPFPTTDPNENS